MRRVLLYLYGLYGGCSRRSVAERLHRPAAFNNYYEETKCAAEHLITSLCDAKEIRLVIVRPSVVIGPSKSYQTGGGTTGLYGLIREMLRLKRHLKQVHSSVAAYANPDVGVNIIPVDYVCHDIFQLFKDPNVPNGVHHATADNNVNIAALVELIARHLDLPNVTLERLDRFDGKRASTIEKLLVRTTAYYNSITRTTKHFEKNDGARWILGMDEVERYVIEGVRAFESVESQLPDHKEIVVTEDRGSVGTSTPMAR